MNILYLYVLLTYWTQ